QFPSASSNRRSKREKQLGTAWLRVATPFGHLMKQKKLRTHLTNQREVRLRISQKFWSSGTCSSSHRGALLHSRAQCSKNAQRCKKQRTLCPLACATSITFRSRASVKFPGCQTLFHGRHQPLRHRPTRAGSSKRCFAAAQRSS